MENKKDFSTNNIKKLFYSRAEFSDITGLSLSSVNRLLKNRGKDPLFNSVRKLGRRVLIPSSIVEYLYGEKLLHTEASNG
jgi:hypothetical protein